MIGEKKLLCVLLISNYTVVLSECHIALEMSFVYLFIIRASLYWYATTHSLHVETVAFTYTGQFWHCPRSHSSCMFPNTVLNVLGTSLRSITLITEKGCLFKTLACDVHIPDPVKFGRNAQVSQEHTHNHIWNPVKLGPDGENTCGSSKSKVVSCRSPEVINLTAGNLRARLQGDQSK